MTEEDKKIAAIFSQNLRDFLSDKNMTQAELAEKIGVTPGAVTYWCNGQKLPRMGKIDILADLFRCERTDLIYENGLKNAKKREFMEFSENEITLISEYRGLNKAGQEKVIEYISDLAENPKYTGTDGEAEDNKKDA